MKLLLTMSGLMTKRRFVEIIRDHAAGTAKELVDLDMIYRITPSAGDTFWLNYTVYFTDGRDMQIYEKHFPRQKLVDLITGDKE